LKSKNKLKNYNNKLNCNKQNMFLNKFIGNKLSNLNIYLKINNMHFDLTHWARIEYFQNYK